MAGTEGTAFAISLGPEAIVDLQAKIDAGEQYFSIGVANTSFDAIGYFTPASAALVVTEAVPLPGSLVLLGAGLLIWRAARRRT